MLHGGETMEVLNGHDKQPGDSSLKYLGIERGQQGFPQTGCVGIKL